MGNTEFSQKTRIYCWNLGVLFLLKMGAIFCELAFLQLKVGIAEIVYFLKFLSTWMEQFKKTQRHSEAFKIN